MYKTIVRKLVRHGIEEMNAGNPEFILKLAAPDAQLVFPGDNSWAAMCRPVVKGRQPHATHRGIEECRRFAQRFVDEGIQFHIEDILVNGPPWRTRVALRVHDFKAGALGDGSDDEYNNRAVAFLELRWGRLLRWEDYEDTERVADWDRRQDTSAAPPI